MSGRLAPPLLSYLEEEALLGCSPLLDHHSLGSVYRFFPITHGLFRNSSAGSDLRLGKLTSSACSQGRLRARLRVPQSLPPGLSPSRPPLCRPAALLPVPKPTSLLWFWREGWLGETPLPAPSFAPSPGTPPLTRPRRVGGGKGSQKELALDECIMLNFLEMDGRDASPRQGSQIVFF